MQCNKDQSQWSIACPTQNQCNIHEVYASRIQDPTRVQVWGTWDILSSSKSTKNATKHWDKHKYWILN